MHYKDAKTANRGEGSIGDATTWKNLNDHASQSGLHKVKDSRDILYKEDIVSERFTMGAVCLHRYYRIMRQNGR